ncbi:tryptophan--tRNA ligase [Candidatus Falkowbacteria bacterium CG11_big_fil_rev_8_21_14_0_20_39_10]|uniref:Tryptophan--tRNA ligase n=1 Tax=Candidatus Falkowbacteria bacterium CG11_big_fil_rev_8_21_14_0_20_39_10 TaxID=1974570 RepID=A0A2M6K965_9BACT|nr:MAG: tryptophan--tRNA ligase [Candidatus Falkowbacteria bacterium CG11_big_fil_rev_8_21_14_0_20_39_10]
MKKNGKQVVLSGIRATGKLHLGNFLGAMRYFVELSQDPAKQCYFFIANLHTLTTRVDPKLIKHDLLEIVLDYLAAGINPENSVIFAQSSVPETCELSWLLGCITPVSSLTVLPHFKDKKEQMESLGQSVNSGILTYPVLMAADILGPRANLVPVGEDQKPHVELTRDLARRFNNLYGPTFPEPQTLEGEDIRVPGLDGSGKMGKSEGNTIDLIDTPEVIQTKIARAVTDPARVRRTDPGTPEICNVFGLHQLLSSPEEISYVANGCRIAGIGCLDCKKILSDNVVRLLELFQIRRRELAEKGQSFILDILRDGGQCARAVISETVKEVKEKMGVPAY